MIVYNDGDVMMMMMMMLIQALLQLEDSYESEMTGLMHDYESAERSFIQALQSTHSNAQLTDAFQKQIVQV